MWHIKKKKGQYLQYAFTQLDATKIHTLALYVTLHSVLNKHFRLSAGTHYVNLWGTKCKVIYPATISRVMNSLFSCFVC